MDCKSATVDCEMGQLRREGWFASPTRTKENAKGAVVCLNKNLNASAQFEKCSGP